MQKIANFIFKCSPKKLAIYLVLGPLILFLAHTILTITIRGIQGASVTNTIFATTLLISIYTCLTVIFIIWISWLYSIVSTSEEKYLGLQKKWFQLAFFFFYFFIVFNVFAVGIEYVVTNKIYNNDYLYLIYASREFVNFGGIMVAYPIICHYAARAVYIKQKNEAATFSKAIPATLLLIFGTVIGIPFLHQHFSSKTSTTSEVTIIYAIALGLCVVLFILGFIAAITGLI